jgi:PAS domain S-box-containing protein
MITRGDIDGNIIHVNQGFTEISGYSAQELIGKNHNILNSRKHEKSFFKSFWNEINKGNTWRGDICNKSSSGSDFWLDTFVIPILGEDNSIKEFFSIRSDVTKNYTSIVENTDKKIAKNRLHATRDSITGMISHELRTPLAAILGFSELLFDELGSEDATAMNQYIRDGGLRLQKIIDDLIFLLELRSLSVDINREALSYNDFVDGVQQIVASNNIENDINMLNDLADQNYIVSLDSSMIYRAIDALVDNANKFSDGGSVELEITSGSIDENFIYDLCFNLDFSVAKK